MKAVFMGLTARTTRRLFLVVGAGLAGVVGAFFAGARINTTASIPVGLYWVSADPVDVGSYVLFCPPLRPEFNEARRRNYIGSGACPGGYGYLMKRVLAAKGDRVSMRMDGVRVNGRVLPFSASKPADGGGRLLPRPPVSDFLLGDAEVLLMAANPKSFDGRYFGPIDRSQIKTAISPVVTW